MRTFLLRRLLQSLVVLFGVSFVVFAILFLTGDPALVLLPPDASAAVTGVQTPGAVPMLAVKCSASSETVPSAACWNAPVPIGGCGASGADGSWLPICDT